MNLSPEVVVSGGFDDVRSRHLRFLEEASKFGPVTVLLWSDETLLRQSGTKPKFPLPERLYFLNAVRYVTRVVVLPTNQDTNSLPRLNDFNPRWWLNLEANGARENFCQQHGIQYRVWSSQPGDFTESMPTQADSGRKKVIVTGCYDWFHSGHVRFFEEVSGYGDLYVIVGHDANIRLLKGEGHPLVPQAERRYLVSAIRYVTQVLISSGVGWLDADPEIRRLKPDIYAVNEDGDKGGKREYCEQLGIEYLVLKRTPAPGLPRRSSTDLRGF